ncbi:MAG: hypothetical protein AAGD25_06795 [Cyanobacteria bacterium P01_F01_bin.150]
MTHLIGTTTLYGTLTTPTELKLHSGDVIAITANGGIAQQLTAKLRQEVALSGVAEWDEEGAIVSFVVDAVVNYEPVGLVAAFREMREKFGRYLEDLD